MSSKLAEPTAKTDWTMHLPPEFAAQLRALQSKAREGHLRRTGLLQLQGALAAARGRGWTLQSLADALGLTRERIRQLVEDVPPRWNTIEIPEPPPRPLTKREQDRLARAVVTTPTLNAEQRAELLALQRKAQARGTCAPDHPAIVAGCELAALIQGYLNEGYRISDIARACGVTRTAVRVRLGRYGYRSLPPSMRCGPGPIAAAMAAAESGRSNFITEPAQAVVS